MADDTNPIEDDYRAQLARGHPSNSPHDPRADFVAAHSNANAVANPIEHDLGIPPAGAAPGVPPPPPQTLSNVPIAKRVTNLMGALSRMAYVPEGQRQDKTLWDALANGVAGVPAEIGREFTDGLSQVRRDLLPQNWQEVQDNLSSPLPLGMKPGLDALNLAFSPLTATATSAVGRPLEYLTGVNRNITGFLASMIAPGGIAKAAKLLKGGEALAAAGDVTKAAGAAEGAAAGGEAAAAEGAAAAGAEGVPAEARAAKAAEGAPAAERAAEGAPAAGEAAAAEAAPEQRSFSFDGEEKPLGQPLSPEQKARLDDFMSGKSPISPIGLTYEQLAAPEQISQIVTDISKNLGGKTPKSDDILRMEAYSMAADTSPSAIMAMKAVPEDADKVMSAQRTVLETAYQEFWRLAREADASSDPAAMDKAQQYGMLVMHYAEQWDVGGTPAGRVLRARQVMMGRSDPVSRNIEQMLLGAKEQGIPLKEVVNKVAQLRPETVPPFMAWMRKVTGRDSLLYGWYNWLLSNPAVIAKKAASDASLGMFNLATRYMAEKTGLGERAIAPGETAALLHGYISASQEAFRIAGRALRAGEGQFHSAFNTLEDGSGVDRISKLANAPADYPLDQVTRPALSYIRSAMPTTWIGAMDDLAKVFNYRAEVSAGAWRQAYQELGAKADIGALNQRAAELRANIPDNLHQTALDRALRNTLQEPLAGPAKTFQDWIDELNVPLPKAPGIGTVTIPLGRIISPFTKISANVARFAYRSSPLPFVMPSALWREEIAAGGAKKALAQAQAGLGTMASMAALPLVLNGSITGNGPTSREERYAWLNAGNKPYSITLPGGATINYNKVEPFGMSLATIADTVELMRYSHEDDSGALAASLALGIGHAMMNKTYMEQWSNLLDAMQDPNQAGSRFIDQLAASFAVPGLVSGVDRAFDENMRAHHGLMETIASRTPGVSNTMPPLRNVWGDPIARSTGLLGGVGRMLLPFDVSPPPDANPVDKFLWDNREYAPNNELGRIGLTPPGQVFQFDEGGRQRGNIRLSTEDADRLKVLTGNGFKREFGGQMLGAKDALNLLVTNKFPDADIQQQFNQRPPAGQYKMIIDLFNGYKKGAKAQFLQNSPDLQQRIQSGRDIRRQQLTAPTMGTAP